MPYTGPGCVRTRDRLQCTGWIARCRFRLRRTSWGGARWILPFVLWGRRVIWWRDFLPAPGRHVSCRDCFAALCITPMHISPTGCVSCIRCLRVRRCRGFSGHAAHHLCIFRSNPRIRRSVEAGLFKLLQRPWCCRLCGNSTVTLGVVNWSVGRQTPHRGFGILARQCGCGPAMPPTSG